LKVRLSILNFFLPISKFISLVHAPFSRKKIYSKHIESIKEHLKPGAVLVTNTEGQLSNLFIDGNYSHAAICSVKEGIIIEAKTTGVMRNNILDFMISKDQIVVLHPTFCDEDGMKFAALMCESAVGSEYDFLFDPANKAFYCSELVQFGYNKFGVWTKRKTLGVDTVLPIDFINSAKSKAPKWTIVWDSEKM